MRAMYQGISSGRFADQMMSSCEMLKYAHSITNASISLPRSWKWSGCATSDTGLKRDERREHQNRERERRQPLAADASGCRRSWT